MALSNHNYQSRMLCQYPLSISARILAKQSSSCSHQTLPFSVTRGVVQNVVDASEGNVLVNVNGSVNVRLVVAIVPLAPGPPSSALHGPQVECKQ